jgi:hypothetical protein
MLSVRMSNVLPSSHVVPFTVHTKAQERPSAMPPPQMYLQGFLQFILALF